MSTATSAYWLRTQARFCLGRWRDHSRRRYESATLTSGLFRRARASVTSSFSLRPTGDLSWRTSHFIGFFIIWS
ncbi:Uncharacterised protein [Bordetella pertussis]|nr:Uncharacterised protein [Bordetella pertussis]